MSPMRLLFVDDLQTEGEREIKCNKVKTGGGENLMEMDIMIIN